MEKADGEAPNAIALSKLDDLCFQLILGWRTNHLAGSRDALIDGQAQITATDRIRKLEEELWKCKQFMTEMQTD